MMGYDYEIVCIKWKENIAIDSLSGVWGLINGFDP